MRSTDVTDRHGFLTTLPGRITTAVLIVVAILTAFVGSGALGGTPIHGTAGGWLSADSTPIAPAGTAFSIWSVIYAGLVGYGIWQFFPVADTARHRAARPWILLGVLLNSAWLWVVQAGWLAVSVLVIVALLACLCRVLVIMERAQPVNWPERILVDGTQGLYLGWVTVATLANVAAWLGSLGWKGEPLGPVAWAIVLVAVATVLAVLTAVYDGGRFAPAAATAWGLAWIAVGRSDGTGLQSPAIAFTAGGAAVVVVLAAVAAWLVARRSSAAARAPRGRGPR